jgi:ElaB/YqjD/DUF883 family membrane-anchored ribosome-binding protein
MTRIAELTDRLASNLESVAEGTERLMESVGREGGRKAELAREQLAGRLTSARDELAHLQHQLAHRSRVMARRADMAMHEHPYTTAALAAGVGAALGVLIALLIERR